jgi:hypothetical protein
MSKAGMQCPADNQPKLSTKPESDPSDSRYRVLKHNRLNFRQPMCGARTRKAFRHRFPHHMAMAPANNRNPPMISSEGFSTSRKVVCLWGFLGSNRSLSRRAIARTIYATTLVKRSRRRVPQESILWKSSAVHAAADWIAQHRALHGPII